MFVCTLVYVIPSGHHHLSIYINSVLIPCYSDQFCYISAYGEAVSYLCFMTLDVAFIREGLVEEKKLLQKLRDLKKLRLSGKLLQMADAKADGNAASSGNASSVISPAQLDAELAALESQLKTIRSQRVFRAASIAGQAADLIIAIAQVEPNPVCCHPAVLGVSGLVAAWTGWFRVWA